MAVFKVIPDRTNVYGSISAEFDPILIINSGDTVQYSCLDAGWGTPQMRGRE